MTGVQTCALPILGTNISNTISILEPIINETKSGKQGIIEIKELIELIKSSNISTPYKFDLSLARGLDYYTGTIFEVKADDVKIGSICGGGRYDNLTEFFGLPDMSGVGISFGADRIFDVMNELNLFPESTITSTNVLFINFGEKEIKYSLPLLSEIRENNISAELYPENDKIKKQMNYANKKNIPFVIIAGENEINLKQYNIKNMQTGEQFTFNLQETINYILKNK